LLNASIRIPSDQPRRTGKKKTDAIECPEWAIRSRRLTRQRTPGTAGLSFA